MFGQFIVNGLITGVLYSLLAIGFALVYNTTRIFHIAAAGIYVVAAYMFWMFSSMLHLPVLIAAVLAIMIAAAVNYLTDTLVYHPLTKRNKGADTALIASIGIMIVLIHLMALLFGNETKVLDNSLTETYYVSNIAVTGVQIWQLIVGGLAALLFVVMLHTSSLGKQLLALGNNPQLFSALGYNRRLTTQLVFIISGLFIGLCSCLNVYDVGLDTSMGMTVFINALVAMVIGGVGRYETCIYGGLLLGVLQGVAIYFFGTTWTNAVSFIVLLILLFVRPQGIAGYKPRIV